MGENARRIARRHRTGTLRTDPLFTAEDLERRVLLSSAIAAFGIQQTFATGAQPASVLAAANAAFVGQTPAIVPLSDTIDGTGGNDNITLIRNLDGTDINWTMGMTGGQFPANDPNGLTINGNGGNDTITLVYTNGDPLPNIMHLNSGTGTFTINGLQGTAPLAGTTIDIERSTVLINYGAGPDPLALIQGYLQAGYNGGAWTGTSASGVITSASAAANFAGNLKTTGIGYADFADGQGVNTNPNTIELTYTLYGDANLDHQVNSADLQILLAFLNRTGAWDQGDFNYDGQVNSADLQDELFTLNTSLGNQAIAATNAAAAPTAAGNSQVKSGAVATLAQAPSTSAPRVSLAGLQNHHARKQHRG
ncbi:MAG TPA: dockerin type I repeat-containing protein [Tepidisphaeraceae bacterium]|jgi:hypothetical protein|nr:dockerin type I repeat-containing protein [Tepidisphaeraceae bacterium]